MMVIKLKEDEETLEDIISKYSEELLKESRNGIFHITGVPDYSNKFCLIYYNYDVGSIVVVPVLFENIGVYREHYNRHLVNIVDFEDIDYTLEMIENMELSSFQAYDMLKHYKDIFLEEEKYEILNYLTNFPQ